jgi:hypothetical protein
VPRRKRQSAIARFGRILILNIASVAAAPAHGATMRAYDALGRRTSTTLPLIAADRMPCSASATTSWAMQPAQREGQAQREDQV